MSVRSRLDEQRRKNENLDDLTPPAVMTTRPQAVSQTSVRGRAEQAASLASPDLPPVQREIHQSSKVGWGTGNTRVRDRQAAEEWNRQQAALAPVAPAPAAPAPESEPVRVMSPSGNFRCR